MSLRLVLLIIVYCVPLCILFSQIFVHVPGRYETGIHPVLQLPTHQLELLASSAKLFGFEQKFMFVCDSCGWLQGVRYMHTLRSLNLTCPSSNNPLLRLSSIEAKGVKLPTPYFLSARSFYARRVGSPTLSFSLAQSTISISSFHTLPTMRPKVLEIA